MSWSNILPWWVYASEVEEHQALMLGAFPDELRAGCVRSIPDHVVDLRRRIHVYDADADGYLAGNNLEGG